MKKIFKTITACALALVMLAISPMTDLSKSLDGTNDTTKAKAATVSKAAEKDEQGNQLYISDVKVGNAYTTGDGPSLQETVSQLESEGYTILKDGADYADLNSGNKPRSIKRGPTEKIIILGYKTTTDPDEAITDLAVMNMNGGFSVEDYNKLLETQMESQIKPFVDNYISALEEYRENLKKPKDSPNYIRADFMRQMLNKITDDDTGNQPLGDLLVNKTKYEMGDSAYNSLSDEKKKEHADILTILMQGNEAIVMELENFVARATDTSDDTWIERMQKTSLSDLRDEMLAKHPNLSKKDINAELDKKYQDDAKRFLKKWPELANALQNVESAQETVENHNEEELREAVDKMVSLDDDAKIDEIVDVYGELLDQHTDALEAADADATVVVSEFLEASDYDFNVGKESGSTLLDFFSQDASVFNGDNIRALYPIVASLSDGQLAGLDLISARDLVTVGLNDESGYKDTDVSEVAEVSVYDGINRDLYKPGGVGLTNDALRKQSQTDDSTWKPSIGCWQTWVTGAASLVSLAATVAVRHFMETSMKGIGRTVVTDIMEDQLVNFEIQSIGTQQIGSVTTKLYFVDFENAWQSVKIGEIHDNVVDKVNRFSQTSINAVTIVLSTVTIALLALTTYFTIKDLMDQADVDFVEIPNYMVEETDITGYNEKGEKILLQNQTAYYRSATCTRIEGKSDTEKKNYRILKDSADLNGDIGRQWLALYYLKKKSGTPILADSLLYQKGGGDVPAGYSTGIHEFGSTVATNLNKIAYLFAKEPPTIRVYFKNAEPAEKTSVDVTGDKDTGSATDADTGSGTGSGSASDTTGSIFTDGSDSGSGITAVGVALGGGIGIVLGALLMALIMWARKRSHA